jgi:glycosyltransferase involved in cell wall biosynthesis
MKTRPDTMIFNSPPLTLGLSSLILAKLLRARAIANISDIWPMSALALGAMRKGWLYNTLENVEHYIYRRSDAVMAQSKETQQHILDRLPEKITFLYRNLDYPSDFIDTYPTLQLQSVKIVYAGLFGVAQGVYDICKSIDFKRLGVEFHLYGDGPEKEAIVKYVTENPACNIFVHDAVPKSEISEILSKYHATIVPLITHIKGAFPSKLYMALSASLPVFYCGAGEGAQFVRDMNIGWVSEPGDYENLANQIKDLTSMPDADYRRLRSHISDLATNTFNFNDQLDRLVNFIVNE